MIPIHDDNKSERTFPIINYLLIAINVIVFIYELSLSQPQLQRFILRYGAIPAELSHNVMLVPGAPHPIYLTIFTGMFIHAGWLHIGGNMLYLWIFGDNVEDAFGHFRYLAFYLLGGVAAAFCQTYVGGPNSSSPMIGASGAIAAVLAAYIILFPKGLVRVLIFLGILILPIRLPALIVIGFWIVLQVWTGVASLGVHTAESGGVAVWAHVGGFAFGVLALWIFRDRANVQRQRSLRSGYKAFDRW